MKNSFEAHQSLLVWMFHVRDYIIFAKSGQSKIISDLQKDFESVARNLEEIKGFFSPGQSVFAQEMQKDFQEAEALFAELHDYLFSSE